jgi:alpha-methylacyl-CoA racemase
MAPASPTASAGRAAAAGPLTGVVVLDLSSVGPAARCTRLLADYGATVVKVGPVPGQGPAPVTPPFFAYSAHRGMRRVQMDVRDPDGRDAFLALAATADVVVESFRPGVVDRLGIGYEALRASNDRIIYCSTSGFGQDGPRSGWAGHDLDYLAVAGYLATTGRRADGGPPIPGATIADGAGGGMHAALAVCAALMGRSTTGEGAYLDVSVADGVLWLMSLTVDEHLATGTEPGPGHDVLTGRYACYDTYRTADGRWLAVAAIEGKFFANLCRALQCEQWIEHQYDDDVQDDVRRDLAAAFTRRDRDDWVTELSGADTCVAPVQAVSEVGADRQYASRHAVVDAKHPGRGAFRQVGPVLAGMARLDEPVCVPDAEVTDTDELLAAAGISVGQLAEMRNRKVIA